MEDEEIQKVASEGYAKIAKQDSSCCTPASPCCGSTHLTQDISQQTGYIKVEEIKKVVREGYAQIARAAPEGANLGLGCGNPLAFASLKEGDIVLDLGSGAGFDCFLAAEKVGERGRVIGVDMAPEMIEKARENTGKGNYGNVEFRLGEIENLPVADNFVDIIISNCVINLVPDKRGVFKEAFRVLKPGGRLIVSDVVLLQELPACIKNSMEAYIGCVAGAIMKDEYISAIEAAGFNEVRIVDETPFPIECMVNDLTAGALIESLGIPSQKVEEIATSVISIKAYGVKAN